MADGYCNCSKCGHREFRPVFKKTDGKYSRRPCSRCTNHANRLRSTIRKRSNAGKSRGAPMTRRERIIDAAHRRTFNEDGSLRLIPLGNSKQPLSTDELKRKAAEILAGFKKHKSKKKKKTVPYQGSCRPIDHISDSNPPEKDGDGDGVGPASKFHNFTHPPIDTR